MTDTLSIYEEIQGQQKAPKPKGTLAIYEELNTPDPEKDQAQLNANLAADKNPDTEAKVIDLANRTGRPQPLVRETMEDTERLANEPIWADVTPGVAKHLAAAQEHAAVSSDDIDNLSTVERTIAYWSTLGKDTVSAWKAGTQNVELGTLAYKRYILGDLSVQEDLDALKVTQVRPPEGQNWFGYGITAAAEMLPLMIEATKGGVERGLEGAAVGAVGAAVVGQLGPQVAFPEEAITVPVAALALGKAGFVLGAAESMFVLEGGLAADEFADIEDEFGNKLDPQAVRVAAVGVGAINAGLEVTGLSAISKVLPGADTVKRIFIRDAVKKALKKETVRKALLEVGKKYAGAVATESITEMAQESANILAAEILKETTNEIRNTSFEAIVPEEAIARIGEAGKKAAAATITLGVPGAAINVRTSTRDVQRAQEYQAAQVQINEKVNESKTKERSPELMEKFLDSAGLGDDVFIKGELAEELLNSNPEIAEKIGLEQQAVALAVSEGQDVRLKLSALHANLEAEEFTQLADIIKPGPAALSNKEAQNIDTVAELDVLVELFQAETADESVFQENLERVRGQALEAGRTEAEVDSWIQIVEAFSRRHADEGGELTSLTRRLTNIQRAGFEETEAAAVAKFFTGEELVERSERARGVEGLGQQDEEAKQVQTQINASGESAASLEALAVEADRKDRGIGHFIMDSRSKKTRPAIGPRPEDNPLNPFDVLVRVEGDDVQMVNQGKAVNIDTSTLAEFLPSPVIETPSVQGAFAPVVAAKSEDVAPRLLISSIPGEARGYGLSMSLYAQTKYNADALAAITDDSDNIILLDQMGIKHEAKITMGSFGILEPSIDVRFPGADFDTVRKAGAVLGHAMLQDAVITAQPDILGDIQGVRARFKGDEKLDAVRLQGLLDAVNPDSDQDGVNFTMEADGKAVRFLDFSGDFEAFQASLTEALGSAYELTSFRVRSEQDAIHQKTGQEIWDESGLTDKPDLQRAAVSSLYKPLWELYKERVGAIERQVTGQPSPLEEVRGSLEKDSEWDASWNIHRGGLKVDSDGLVPLTHFGTTTGLTALDPTQHGTGAAGAELARKGLPGWIDKTYLGQPGYRREAQIPSAARYFARVQSSDLYDLDNDPLGIIVEVVDANTGKDTGQVLNFAETAIFDRGYRGYFSGDVVAMLEPVVAVEVTNVAEEATGRAGYDAQGTQKAPSLTLYQKSPVGFYSPLRRAVQTIDAKAMPAQDWLNRLKKTPGVKQEELVWTSFAEFLSEQKGKVSKEQVLGYLGVNGVQVEDVTLRGDDPPREILIREQARVRTEEGVVEIAVFEENAQSAFNITVDEEAGNVSVQRGDKDGPFLNIEALTGAGINDQTEFHGFLAIDRFLQADIPSSGTLFADEVLPGGEDYNEILLKIPPKKIEFLFHDIFVEGELVEEGVHGVNVAAHIANLRRYNNRGAEVLSRPSKEFPEQGEVEAFRGTHFPDESNVLAHIRSNTRFDSEGNKVWFIEEIQSDWGLEGRRKGFQVPGQIGIFNLQEIDGVWAFTNEDGQTLGGAFATEQEALESQGRFGRGGGIVPPAPFVATNAWQGLVLKKVLYEAALQGFDKVAWISGEQTSERYSLDKKITALAWNAQSDTLFFELPGGAIEQRENVTREDLARFVGKEIADRLLNNRAVDVAQETYNLSGADLKIEAQWARNLYDKAIPSFFKKFGKKYGAQVKNTIVPITQKDVQFMTFETDPETLGAGFDLHKVNEHGDPVFFRHVATAEEARNVALAERQVVSESTQQSIEITEEMRNEILDLGLPLFQGRQTPKGALTAENDKYLIRLFEGADESTLIHETSHVFVKEIRSLVRSGNASKALIDDWGKIQEWLGVTLEEGMTVPQHEQFARAFETYLLEGKAPSRELESVFQRFRTWLVEIYKTAKRLDANLTNEIRGVFDRLLATEDEVDLYSEEIGLRVRTKKEMDALGLTEEDRAFLTRLIQGANDKATVKLQKQKDRSRKTLMDTWREEAKNEVEKMPIYKLRDSLAVKGQGIDIDIIREDYGDALVQQINSRRLGMLQKNGQNPAQVAAEFDYENTKLMLDTLANSESKTQRVDEIVAVKDLGHDGQFPPDGPVLENPDLETYLDAMGRHIGKALGREERITATTLKRYAERNLADMPLNQALRIDRFLSAMQRAMKQEREAIAKGDFETALTANRQARVNYQYARQVKKLQSRVDSFTRRSKRIAGNKGSIAPDYLDNLKEVLRRYSVVKTAPAAPEKMPSLESLIPQDDVYADTPVFSDWLFNRQDVRKLKELTADEFFELFGFVKWLQHKGTEKALGNKAVLTSLGITIEEGVFQTVEPMKTIKDKKKIRQADRLKGIKSWFREQAAENKMLLFLMRAADGFSNVGPKGVAGPNETLIYDNVIGADNRYLVLRNEYNEAVKSIMLHFGPKIGNIRFPKNLDTGVAVPENLAAEGLEWTYERLLTIAFNMGTEYNKTAVMEGFNLTEESLQQLLDIFEDSDWVQIQRMWDVVNSYWGRLSEVYERRHGIRPTKVKAVPFTTKDGRTLVGGYYPLRFDASLDKKTAEREELDLLKHVSNAAFSPAPVSGMLKKRRGPGGKPVKLTLSVLTQHLDYVTKYIAFAETVRDVVRITDSDAYRAEFKRVMGPQFQESDSSIKRLLKDILGVDRERMNAFDKAIGAGRRMSTRFILGANTSVASKQGYSIFGFLFDMGPEVYRQGLLRVATDPWASHKFMLEISPAMKDRAGGFDRDLVSKMDGNFGKAARVRDIMNFFLIKLIDGLTVLPSWHGAYIQGMDMFDGDRGKAVAHADKSIAASQPFNRTVDMARRQRSKKGSDVMFTIFSSFTMKFGNRSWYFTAGAKAGKINWPTYITQIAVERVLPPMLMNIMFASIWGEEPDWEDIGLDVLIYQFIGMPFFRDLAVAVGANLRYAQGSGAKRDVNSPAFLAVDLLQKAVAAAFQWFLDMEDPDKEDRAQWALFEILSFLTGVPASRVGQKIKKGMEEIENGESSLGTLIGIPNYNVRRD